MSPRTSLADVLATGRRNGSGETPQWLLEHLIAQGHLDADGISRRARLRPCRRCGAIALAGHDADIAALAVWCDPVPMTALGEMLSILEGRATYELRHIGGRWVINPRDAGRIRANPAGNAERCDVLRTHSCRSRSPSPPEIAPTSYAEARPLDPPGSPAPF